MHYFCGRPVRTWLFAVVGLSALVSACALGPSEGFSDASSNAGGSGGAGGSDIATPDELAFDDPSTDWLLMDPGSRRTLKVKATPAGSYVVNFALLPDQEDNQDDDLPGAELSTNTVGTNELGFASVDLTAPNGPAIFTVRASAGEDVTARLTVEVSEPGLRRVIVHPDYSGMRQPTAWVAGAHVGVPCSMLGDFTGDAKLTGTAPFAKDPEVTNVPVTVDIAITVRGDFMVSGCVEAQIPTDGMAAVTVPIRDLPLNLEGDFTVSLSIAERNAAFTNLISTIQDDALRRFSPLSEQGKVDDVNALLDAMEEAAGAGSPFAVTRASQSWNDAVNTDADPDFGPKMLTSYLQTWFDAGIEALAQPGALQGALRARHLTIDTVTGIDAESAGFSVADAEASFEALSGDQLLLGAALSWHFGSLVTALADNPARAAVSGATGVPSALRELLSCDKLARTLAAPPDVLEDDPNYLYDGCNVPCGTELCGEALILMWRQARDPSSEDASLMHISATAVPTELSEHAKPLHFDGEWTGQFASPIVGDPAAVTGAWSGGN